jgi:16S rRNA C1402 (ribose-2'-O) methylase RsmI
MHEHVVRGTAADVKTRIAPTMPRGEFVLIVRGLGWRKRDRVHVEADDEMEESDGSETLEHDSGGEDERE